MPRPGGGAVIACARVRVIRGLLLVMARIFLVCCQANPTDIPSDWTADTRGLLLVTISRELLFGQVI